MRNSSNDDNNNKTVKLAITLPRNVLEKIDKLRKDIPRSRFIRRAVESYISKSSR